MASGRRLSCAKPSTSTIRRSCFGGGGGAGAAAPGGGQVSSRMHLQPYAEARTTASSIIFQVVVVIFRRSLQGEPDPAHAAEEHDRTGKDPEDKKKPAPAARLIAR